MPIVDRFRNWHIEAYLDGREAEVPEHLLPLVKAAAEKRLAEADSRGILVVDHADGPLFTKAIDISKLDEAE